MLYLQINSNSFLDIDFFVNKRMPCIVAIHHRKGDCQMKIYIDIQRPIKDALQQVLFTVMLPDSPCDNPQEADLIIVETKERLHELYHKKKFFAVLSIKEVKNLPANARWIPLLEFIHYIGAYMDEIGKALATRKQEPVASSEEDPLFVETGLEYTREDPGAERSFRVLVVDDKPQNLQLALECLQKDHFVTLASGYAEALQLISKKTYDAVLSDCQMLPETKNSALSLEAITIGQTVHNGIFLIFHATKRGARVAIVTDANHHMDWVSALFDDRDLYQPQEVNGQPVLLINYMGKRWDEALNALMAL